MALDPIDEKRSFKRMDISTQVDFRLKAVPKASHRGQSLDLSATGLKMLTDIALEVGDEIDIIMQTGNERLPPFIGEGIVRRVEVSNNKYLVSVELSQTG